MRALVVLLIFSLLFALSFSSKEKEIAKRKIVLKRKDIVVEQERISEQTQLIQEVKEEVDELCDTTYKLNRLLIKDTQGESDVRRTESRTSRGRYTH